MTEGHSGERGPHVPPARRLASVVEPGWAAEVGDALPLLWHWAYFPELAPADDLGPDGHPRRTDPWAGRFPRRLAGGGRVTGLAPFVLGAPAVRRSQLAGATERAGRQGGLVVCDWLHTYLQSGRTVRQETQTLIYAGGPVVGSRSTAGAGGTGAGPARGLRGPMGTGPAPRIRPCAPLPLLRRHLELAPDPLRPALRHAGRGLRGPAGARAAAHHAPGSGGRAGAGSARHHRVPGPIAGPGHRHRRRLCPGRWHRRVPGRSPYG